MERLTFFTDALLYFAFLFFGGSGGGGWGDGAGGVEDRSWLQAGMIGFSLGRLIIDIIIINIGSWEIR